MNNARGFDTQELIDHAHVTLQHLNKPNGDDQMNTVHLRAILIKG